MCKQCVRADRREAEGRPAEWQTRDTFYVNLVPDLSAWANLRRRAEYMPRSWWLGRGA